MAEGRTNAGSRKRLVPQRAHRRDARRQHPRQARASPAARTTTAACWPSSPTCAERSTPEGAIRPLRDGAGERDALLALLTAAYGRPGWDAEVDRIRAFVPDGWRVLDAEDGDVLAACGCAVPWGTFGWVGLVAVRPDLGRRGLGRAVTEVLCDRLAAAGATTVALDASDKGRGLYLGMGFADAGAVRCLVPPARAAAGRARGDAGVRRRPRRRGRAADTAAFGASREALLRRLSAEGAPAFVTRGADGAVDGYALVVPSDGTIGPSAARGEDAVVALLGAALAAAPVDGGRVLVLPESAHAATLERLGFVETRRLAHLRRPGGPLPGARQLLVSGVSYAIG